MKKINYLWILMVVLIIGLTSCQLKEPQLSLFSENPNVYFCNVPVPNPNIICIYQDGKNKEFNQNSERYKTIWKNMHNLVNNEKIKKNAIDTIYSDRQIKEIKSNTLCFEFLYDHVFIVDNCKAGFDGIFFLFDNHCLTYGYYSINAYIDDNTKEKQYTNFWKIEEQKNTVEKIKQLIEK